MALCRTCSSLSQNLGCLRAWRRSPSTAAQPPSGDPSQKDAQPFTYSKLWSNEPSHQLLRHLVAITICSRFFLRSLRYTPDPRVLLWAVPKASRVISLNSLSRPGMKSHPWIPAARPALPNCLSRKAHETRADSASRTRALRVSSCGQGSIHIWICVQVVLRAGRSSTPSAC